MALPLLAIVGAAKTLMDSGKEKEKEKKDPTPVFQSFGAEQATQAAQQAQQTANSEFENRRARRRDMLASSI